MEPRGEEPAGLVEAGIRKGAARDPGVPPEPTASTFLQVGQCDGAPGHHSPRGLPCRPPPLPAPDKAVLSLDKIAKRECKVLVVEPVK